MRLRQVVSQRLVDLYNSQYDWKSVGNSPFLRTFSSIRVTIHVKKLCLISNRARWYEIERQFPRVRLDDKLKNSSRLLDKLHSPKMRGPTALEHCTQYIMNGSNWGMGWIGTGREENSRREREGSGLERRRETHARRDRDVHNSFD